MHIRSFFNGLVTGVILGILFAPASGEETRKRLAKKADDIQDMANDKVNDAIESLTDERTPVLSEAPLVVTLTALAVESDENITKNEGD